MIESGEELRDLARLLVPASGSLQETGSQADPYRLVDPAGGPVTAVTAYFRDLQAACVRRRLSGRMAWTLLRWFRFLWAIEVAVGSGDPSRGPGYLEPGFRAGL